MMAALWQPGVIVRLLPPGFVVRMGPLGVVRKGPVRVVRVGPLGTVVPFGLPGVAVARPRNSAVLTGNG
jgi:hypothetical protein